MNGPIPAGGEAMPGVTIIDGAEIARFIEATYPSAQYGDRLNIERTVEAFLEWRAENNGPAATGIAPDRGSALRRGAKENEETTTTAAKGAPSRAKRPTDKEIVAAFDNLMGDIQSLRQAAIVLDNFASAEFRSGRMPKGSIFEYGLSSEDVDGILYLSTHVRDLAWDLDKAFDKAFGLEGA